VTEEEWRQETVKAELGNTFAQTNLCLRQIAQNKELEKARVWCAKAAESGHQKAQTILSGLYFTGMGGSVNYAEAYFWQRIAQQNGQKEIPQGLRELPQLLTARQVAEIETRIHAWHQKRRSP
jgi:TPR repeat protein